MSPSRIKDPALAAQIDEGHLAWHRHITPITEHFCARVAQHRYHGRRIAYWGHLTFNTIPILLALRQAGAEVTAGACNVDSTNDAVVAYLHAHGITVYGWRGMSSADYAENLALARAAEADYLCDMGGELIEAYLDKSPPPVGALEATTSGLTRLRQAALTFPVFDWNSIPLKDRLENRFHVGDGVWPAFSYITEMGLFGRHVLVIGYGPVGKGIAERARSLGGLVHVADLDPVRLLEARYHGCEPVSLAAGLAQAEIIVTATGVEGVLAAEQLQHVRPGALVFNAGHSNREVDIDWLYQQPHTRLKPHLERFDLGGTHLYLLARGSLLNLAAGPGPHGTDLFDHYTAVMLAGLMWMLDGLPPGTRPGLQPYPAHLEREIASMSVQLSAG